MAGSYDYGNARVAALRGRLLDAAALRRLEGSGSLAAFLVVLEQADDWRAIVRDVRSLATDAGVAIDAAIDRHRAARLATLPVLYPPPARSLVEALVMQLDLECVLAVLRRRRAGQAPEAITPTIVGGALLGPAELGRLARAPSIERMIPILREAGLLERAEARALVAGMADGQEPAVLERSIVDAWRRARDRRAAGSGADALAVRTLLALEADERLAIEEEARATDQSEAAALERRRRLARLDSITRAGHRDPLGIGAVAGYIAAVEAQAIRLRAIATGSASGWPRERVGAYMTVAGPASARPTGAT